MHRAALCLVLIGPRGGALPALSAVPFAAQLSRPLRGSLLLFASPRPTVSSIASCCPCPIPLPGRACFGQYASFHAVPRLLGAPRSDGPPAPPSSRCAGRLRPLAAPHCRHILTGRCDTFALLSTSCPFTTAPYSGVPAIRSSCCLVSRGRAPPVPLLARHAHAKPTAWFWILASPISPGLRSAITVRLPASLSPSTCCSQPVHHSRFPCRFFRSPMHSSRPPAIPHPFTRPCHVVRYSRLSAPGRSPWLRSGRSRP